MHPILFRLGVTPVYTYGTLMLVAVGAALLLLASLAKREGLPTGPLLGAYGAAIAGGIVGARLLYVLANLGEVGDLSLALDARRGGLFAYGGFLGAHAGGYLALRWSKIRVLAAADLSIPCFAAWIAILRIGCYGFGCDFGVPLPAGAPAWLARLGTFPHWAPGTLDYGDGAPAWAQHVREGRISSTAIASLPVHPTQLYEVLLGGLLFWAWLAARKFQRFRGQLFLGFVTAYGACRFALELVRDDPERGALGPLAAEHRIIPAGLAVFGIVYAVRIAPVVENVVVRRITQAAAFVPALVALAVLWPASFAATQTVMLSVTQWAALVTGVAAGYAFAWLHRRALADPAGAMEAMKAGAARGRDAG